MSRRRRHVAAARRPRRQEPPEGPPRRRRRRWPTCSALLGDAPRERVAADRVPAPDPGRARLPAGRAPRRARAGDEARDDRGLRGRDVLPPLRRRRRRAKRRRRRSPCASARRCRARWRARDALRDALLAHGDADVRVLGAPCIGRCEQAPAAVVGRNPVDHATLPRILRRDRRARASKPPPPPYVDLAAYRARRRLPDARRMRRRRARRRGGDRRARELRRCAAWAARAFRPAANGGSSAPSRRRG